MKRFATLAIAITLLSTSVGCYQFRGAGFRGGCGGCGCTATPGGGFYGGGQPGGYMAPQQGAFISPTGNGVNLAGPTAVAPPIYGAPYSATAMAPVYGTPYATTAMAPMDPLPTY